MRSLPKTPKHLGVCIVVGLALSAALVTSVAAHSGGAVATSGSGCDQDRQPRNPLTKRICSCEEVVHRC